MDRSGHVARQFAFRRHLHHQGRDVARLSQPWSERRIRRRVREPEADRAHCPRSLLPRRPEQERVRLGLQRQQRQRSVRRCSFAVLVTGPGIRFSTSGCICSRFVSVGAGLSASCCSCCFCTCLISIGTGLSASCFSCFPVVSVGRGISASRCPLLISLGRGLPASRCSSRRLLPVGAGFAGSRRLLVSVVTGFSAPRRRRLLHRHSCCLESCSAFERCHLCSQHIQRQDYSVCIGSVHGGRRPMRRR
jgi:hypothetical protein